MIRLFIRVASILLYIDLAIITYIVARKIVYYLEERFRKRHLGHINEDLDRYLHDQESLQVRAKKISLFEKRMLMDQLLERKASAKVVDEENAYRFIDQMGYVDKNIKRLKSKFWWRQATAAYFLGQFHVTRALEALLVLLGRTHHREVILKTSEAIITLSDTTYLALVIRKILAIDEQNLKQVTDLLESVKEDPFPILRSLSQEKPIYLRVFLEVMGQRKDHRINPYLMDHLQDEEPEVVISVLKAADHIGGIKDGEFYQGLLERLADDNWVIRAFSTKLMIYYHEEEVEGLLKEKMRDPKWRVRSNAATALLKRGGSGVFALSTMLEDEDRFARDMAWQVLQDQDIHNRLLLACEGDEGVYRLIKIKMEDFKARLT